MDLTDEKAPKISIYLNTKKKLTFHPRQSQTLKKYFANLASDLVK